MFAFKRALMFSTADKYISLVCNFAAVAAVSRILTPQEIGISVVCMAVVGLAISAREFSSANFLIQRPELPPETIRAAFTVMLVFTVVIAVGITIFAPFFAMSSGDANVVPYLRVVAVCLLFELITTPIVTLLRREMAFGKVALINIAGVVTNAAATVGFALMGFSYMSFAFAWLANSVVTNTLALTLRPDFWMFKPAFRNWGAVIEFGGYNGGTVLLYRVYESIPYLLLGQSVSPHAAALFGRSTTICQVPDKLILGGAISVILPAFSAQLREGLNLKKSYLASLEIITALQWPALLVLAVLAYPAVEILLGQQWLEIVPLVRIMAVASLFSFSFDMNYPIMVSMGAIAQSFQRALLSFPASAIIMAIAVMVGGLQGAAWSMMVIVPFQALIAISYVRRLLAMRWSEVGRALWRSGIVALVSVSGPLVLSLLAGPVDTPVETVIAIVLSAICWLAGLWATSHPFLLEMGKAAIGFRRLLSLQPL